MLQTLNFMVHGQVLDFVFIRSRRSSRILQVYTSAFIV